MRELLAVVALAGCSPTTLSLRDGAGQWDTWRPHTADDAVLRIAGGVPDLQYLHHDVALVCPAPTPGHAPPSGCEAGRLDASGLRSRGISGIVSAWSFDDQRLLTLTPTLSLGLDDGTTRQVLARGAVDPRVADDARRVLYVQLDGEPTEFWPGDRGYLTVLDVDSGVATRLTDDPLDSSPWMVPDSDDVLFTSARTGLASLWLLSGGQVHQVSNVGKTHIDPDFVPVPSRELVWLPGTRTAVFSAHYGTHELWSIDVDSGEAVHLGPGRLPALHPSGGVVAYADDPGHEPTVVHYLGGAR